MCYLCVLTPAFNHLVNFTTEVRLLEVADMFVGVWFFSIYNDLKQKNKPLHNKVQDRNIHMNINGLYGQIMS